MTATLYFHGEVYETTMRPTRNLVYDRFWLQCCECGRETADFIRRGDYRDRPAPCRCGSTTFDVLKRVYSAPLTPELRPMRLPTVEVL